MRLLREPLAHFAVLGAALFLTYHLARRSEPAGGREILVGAAQVEHLKATFLAVWRRPPTGEELDALIDDYVREEVLCREAVALGLDREDPVIRARLRERMRVVAENAMPPREPGEGELRSFLAAHPETFAVGGNVPPWEQVRDRVRREWGYARREESADAFYEALRRRYTVKVEQPAAPATPASAPTTAGAGA